MTSQSLCRTVATTLARNTAWAALGLASYTLVASFAPVAGAVTGPDHAPTRVERMVERNGCWSGEAPAGAEPTRALVTVPHGMPRLVRADVGYEMWLGDRRGTVHAFCP